MARVLVAGATGALGRLVVAALGGRGHSVVALARRPPSPPFAEGVDVRLGEALEASTLAGAFDGVDVLVSCLGASTLPDPTKGLAGYDRIDWPANRNLADAAKAAGVRKVVYVSVAGARENRDLTYFDAHERVVDHIDALGLARTIVRPTGFYSAVEEYLKLARRGFVPLFGDGTARSNPIHDEDLAQAVADAVTADRRDWDVGGPDVLARRDFGTLAFEALGKRPRFVPVPAFLVGFVAGLLTLLLPRVGQAIAFIVRVSTHPCEGEPYGTRRLRDHFAERVGRKA